MFHHHYFLFLTVLLFLPFPIRSWRRMADRASIPTHRIWFGCPTKCLWASWICPCLIHIFSSLCSPFWHLTLTGLVMNSASWLRPQLHFLFLFLYLSLFPGSAHVPYGVATTASIDFSVSAQDHSAGRERLS